MRDTTASDSSGQQAVDVATVAEGVYQLKLPVPFPLAFVAAYLIAGDDGWTVIDAGYDYPAARVAWGAGAAEVGCDLDHDVSSIVVTHHHPDHIGAARWLQRRSGAPVLMLGDEIDHARLVWDVHRGERLMSEFFARHGMHEEHSPLLRAAKPNVLLPDRMLALHPGDELAIAGEDALRVFHAPGHADHMLMLHDEAQGLLFAADQVLMGITPNIGVWPETEPQPLARYLNSLAELRALKVNLVLPGHGPLIEDLQSRITELLSHHEKRLETMHAALGDMQETAFAVSRKVFRANLTPYEQRFALAETLAHLEHLVLEDQIERIEGRVVTYRAK